MRTFIARFIGISLIASSLLLNAVQACRSTAVKVDVLGAKASGIFSLEQVQSQANLSIAKRNTDYRPDGYTTLACVDARSDFPIVGTPGGDLAEFSGAVYTFLKATNKAATFGEVNKYFKRFLDQNICADRPFFYHTDDTRLLRVFQNVTARFGRTVSVLPTTTPTNETEYRIWLDELSQSEAQGCGHIRLMIANPSLYGLDSNAVPRLVIQAFYHNWWRSSLNGKKRFDFVINLGPLIGKAVAVVNNAGPKCDDYSPAITPNELGSSVFVYTPNSAAAFRKLVLSPFFVQQSNNNALNVDSFFTTIDQLHSTQLTSTLTYLPPANTSSLFSLAYSTVGTPDADEGRC